MMSALSSISLLFFIPSSLASFQEGKRSFTFPARLGIEDVYMPSYGQEEQSHVNEDVGYSSWSPTRDEGLSDMSQDFPCSSQVEDYPSSEYHDQAMSPAMHRDAALLLQPWNTATTSESSSDYFSIGGMLNTPSSMSGNSPNGEQVEEMANPHKMRYTDNVEFPTAPWQEEYTRAQIEKMYTSISSQWPHDMDPWTKNKCYRCLYYMTLKHKKLREDLLAGDEATIRRVASQTSPDKVLARARGPRRDTFTGERWRNFRAAKTGWFLGHLTQKEYDKIMQGLINHWKLKTATVTSRLLFYAQTQGLITSPELLLSDDPEDFSQAAALIFNAERSGKFRALGPDFQGTFDELHQTSERYGNLSKGPFFIDYEQWTSLPSSQRFNSHEWQKERSYAAIKTIHGAVVRQWVPWLNAQYITRQLKNVNQFLQDHQEYIQRILDGDEVAAFTVARECIQSMMLRVYNADFHRLMQEGAMIL